MKSIQFLFLAIMLLVNASPLHGQSEIRSTVPWQRKIDPELSRVVFTMASSTLQPLELIFNEQRLQLIVEASDPLVVGEIEEIGGFVNTIVGKFMTVDIPVDNISKLLALDRVLYVGIGPPLHRFNDQAKQHVGADQVHLGNELMSGYQGEGVILGLIDDGIDIMHPDFRDPEDSTKSRVAYLWNQDLSSTNRPSGFSYGREYLQEEIEAALVDNDSTLIKSENYDSFFGGGHGTVVVGSAAGNRGIAPKATIIAVALRNFGGASVIDAARYIIEKAEMMNMSCVINCSWGSYYPADGSGELSRAYNRFMEGNNRIGFVAAAGNSGPAGVYWTAELANDTVYNGRLCAPTLFLRLNVLAGDLDSLFVNILVDSVQLSDHAPLFDYRYLKTTDTLGPISFSQVKQGFRLDTMYHDDQSMAGIVSLSSGSEILSKGKQYATFGFFINDLVDWTQFDLERNVLNFFRIQIHGSGSFFGYFDGLLPSFTDPGSKGFPTRNFLVTRNEYNVGPPAAASGVVAVGASTNRSYVVTTSGDTVFARSLEGDLAWFSSAGVKMEERIKPEITAPGYLIQSSLSNRYLKEIGAFWQVVGTPPTLGDPAHPDLLVSGTSLSSPIVAGTVALMWQANPDLTFAQIRDIITSTALTDEFTETPGPTPNSHWGYGKINALTAVREAERLLDATSNLDFKSHDITVFPVPASSEISIDFRQSDVNIYSMFVSDIHGKVIDYRHFQTSPKSIEHSIRNLPNGAYMITLITDRGKLAKKIVKF